MAYQVCNRFPTKQTKLPRFDAVTGIKSKKSNYLGFIVNRPTTLQGIGIYGTQSSLPELSVQYGVYADDFCNPVNQKIPIIYETLSLPTNKHRSIIQIIFPYSIKLKCCQQYILYLNFDNYQTFRGYDGVKCVRTDQVQFTFNDDFEELSLTTVSEGNFPELYYTLSKDDYRLRHVYSRF